MPAFLFDTFNDADGTPLTGTGAHVGEIGAAWSPVPTTTSSGSVVAHRAHAAVNSQMLYSSGAPGSTDYVVNARVHLFDTTLPDTGIIFRCDNTAGTIKLYSFTIFASGGSIRLYKNMASDLGTIACSLAAGDYDISATVSGTTTTSITCSVRRVSDGFWLASNGVFTATQSNCVTTTDVSSPNSLAGRAGLWLSNSPAGAGSHVGSISASTGATLASGTTSIAGATSSSVSVATTTATGGTSPYNYQFQRAPDIAGSPGTFANVGPNSTAATYLDTTVAALTKYWYRTITTDAVVATVTSPSVSVTTPAPGTTVPVTDPNLYFSPFNWYSDGGGAMAATNIHAGSSFAQSNNPGAYLRTGFSGTSVSLTVDVSPLAGFAAADYPTLVTSVDGAAFATRQLLSTDSIIVLASGLFAGTHTLEVCFAGISPTLGDRWTAPANVVKVANLVLDNGAALSAPALRSQVMLGFGDSITEGVGDAPPNQDATQSYLYMLMRVFNAELGMVAFSGQGYELASGSVPNFNTAWNSYSSGKGRLIGGLLAPAPTHIIVNHGTNGVTTAGDVSTMTTALRASAPAAMIFHIVPYGQDAAPAINAGVNNYKSANSTDGNVYAVDLGVNLRYAPTGIHPLTRGHAIYGAMLAQKIQGLFGGNRGYFWRGLSGAF
jgi:lysophospholipase L1-like esterase